jgi:hypothetical protein
LKLGISAFSAKFRAISRMALPICSNAAPLFTL